jgi:G:T/U mismatch-specific DNA glycosylase
MTKVEQHPLEPFLPAGARVLMLGSFPPPRQRWCIDFYYPNYLNDMWRIMGLLFFRDKNHFCLPEEKRFDKEVIVRFCTEKGIAIYDTATAVVRQKGNASDKFLEIVEPTDVKALLEKIPTCRAVVTTGEKASVALAEALGCDRPKIGSFVEIHSPRELRFYRMPSSSRAYPMKLEKKSAFYRTLFDYL